MSSDTLQSAIAFIRSGDKETGKLLLAELICNDQRMRRRCCGCQ
jgi:hypothetical protein